jgi:hypothetical protein
VDEFKRLKKLNEGMLRTPVKEEATLNAIGLACSVTQHISGMPTIRPRSFSEQLLARAGGRASEGLN